MNKRTAKILVLLTLISLLSFIILLVCFGIIFISNDIVGIIAKISITILGSLAIIQIINTIKETRKI